MYNIKHICVINNYRGFKLNKNNECSQNLYSFLKTSIDK